MTMPGRAVVMITFAAFPMQGMTRVMSVRWSLEQLEEGKDVILEIEAEGAFKVKEQMPEALLIYMLPPSMAELKARLVGRGTETPDKVEKRLRKAREEELDKARKYDFLIVNDDLEKCISELHRMIQTRTGISPEDSDVLEKLAGEEA